MDKYEEKCNTLIMQIKSSQEIIQDFRTILKNKTDEWEKHDKILREYSLELSNINNKRKKLITKHDKKINNISSAINLLAVLSLTIIEVMVCSNLLSIGVSNRIFSIILMILTCFYINAGFIFVLKLTVDKIVNIIHNRIVKNSECVELTKQRTMLEEKMLQEREKTANIENEINTVQKEISNQVEFINLSTTELDKLKQDIIRSAVGDSAYDELVMVEKNSYTNSKVPKRVRNIEYQR